MKKRKKINLIIAIVCIMVISVIFIPPKVSGEVKQITEIEDKLDGITEEEKLVLEKLFTINQEIDELEREEDRISGEIETLQLQIQDLEHGIEEKQTDYDDQRDILKQVLIDYQRGGPATYLEILFGADNLSDFLKSINIIKDISFNVNDLLASLEEGKKALEEEKARLDEKAEQLLLKNEELNENIHSKQLLKEEQEIYLASLQENKEYYQEQLDNLKLMWADSRMLFSEIVAEFTDIINAGYFTTDDLNINISFFSTKGFIEEVTFNRILEENSDLPKTVFHFYDNQVVIEVPEKHLLLKGNFIVAGECAVQYEVTEGTFYDMPLEPESIEELFHDGPFRLDFKMIAKEMIPFNFTLVLVESKEGQLGFAVKLLW